MIYLFGRDVLDEYIDFSGTSRNPTYQFPYSIEILTKDKLRKKLFFFGAPDCKISEVEFEEGEKGSLNGSMTITNFETFLEYGDWIIVRYNGIADYIGKVTTIPGVEGGSVEIASILNEMERQTYIGSFSNKTKLEILETVISALFTNTQINWNENLVDLDSTETFSPDYPAISEKDIIEDWAKSEDDRYYKVNNEFFFEVKHRDSTIAVEDILYPGNYSKAKYKKDVDKIKFTRTNVYYKLDDVETYIQDIPDGTGSYPYFTDIEDEIGGIPRYKKLVAPDGLSSSEALNWAYGEVTAEMIVTESLDIDGIDRTEKDIRPGQLIRCYMPPNWCWKELIDTESITNWTGDVTLNSTLPYDGTYSILVNGSGLYTFPIWKKYKNIKKLCLFAYGNYGNKGSVKIIIPYPYEITILTDESGNILTDESGNILVADETEHEIGQIFIDINDSWNYIEIPIEYNTFSKIKFNLTNTKIDYIQAYAVDGQYYDLFCESRKIKLSNDNMNLYSVKLGSQDTGINDLQFQWNKEIERRQV